MVGTDAQVGLAAGGVIGVYVAQKLTVREEDDVSCDVVGACGERESRT